MWTPNRLERIDKKAGKFHKRHSAKLTEREAAEVKWIGINLKVSQQFVADRYRVSRSSINGIFNGYYWKHTVPIKPPYSIEKSMRSHARAYSGPCSSIFRGYSK